MLPDWDVATLNHLSPFLRLLLYRLTFFPSKNSASMSSWSTATPKFVTFGFVLDIGGKYCHPCIL